MESSKQAALIRTAMEEVLASAIFERAPVLSRMLRFIVESAATGDASSLKEVVIGYAVFDRRADYDTKIDPVVRVNASRLRHRLEMFYRSGAQSPLKIVLPKGSYVPLFEPREASTSVKDHPVSLRDVAPDIAVGKTRELGAHPGASRPRRARFVSIIFLAAAGCAICALFGTLLSRSSADQHRSALERWSARPFAESGRDEEFAAISPDGQTVAFEADEEGKKNTAIYLQSVSSGSPRRITPIEFDSSRPAWSPDGKHLAYLRSSTDASRHVMVYSLEEGTEKLDAELQGGPLWLCRVPHLSWSKDSSHLYTSASSKPDGTCGIASINLQTHLIELLTTPPDGVAGDLEAAASPDGGSVAFLRNYSYRHSDVFVLNLNNGEVRRISHDLADLLGLAWSRDGASIIVASNRGDRKQRLWRMSLRGGAPVAMTDGSSAPTFPSNAKDKRNIMATEFRHISDIWRQGPAGLYEVISNGAANLNPTLSPDGQNLLFDSDRTGVFTVWISNTSGHYAKPLLQNQTVSASAAAWSPDGSQIAFECQIENVSDLCITDAKGTVVRQVTRGVESRGLPSWSGDGRGLYYRKLAVGRQEIFRLDLASGKETQITFNGGTHAEESSDGRRLYISTPDGAIEALSLGKGGDILASRKVQRLPDERKFQDSSVWRTSKAGLIFLANTVSGQPAVFEYGIEDSTTIHLLNLEGPGAALGPYLSQDQKTGTIFFTREKYREDIELLEPADRKLF